MNPASFSRQIVRQKLAELLREPLERVANETRLRKLGRYDAAVARELARSFGLALSEDQLRALDRVRDLLQAVESAPRLAGGTTRSDAATTSYPPEPSGPPPATADPGPPPAGTYVSALPYEDARIHAAAVYCSDGRVGEQIDEFLHQGLSLPRYDRVACPGGPAALAGRLMAFWESRGVEDQLRFLLAVHRLGTVVLIAHEGCAYYAQRLGIAATATEAEQRKDLALAAAALRRLGQPLDVPAYFARTAGGRVRFEPA